MSSFLVKIVKAFEGHEWEQTYAILTNSDDTPGLTEDDWSNATDGQTNYSDAYTDPSNGAYQGLGSLIHALLGFERNIHLSPVQFVRLFAWDGLPNPTEESTFFTTPLSFAGLRDLMGSPQDEIAPGNISWMIGKQPLGFGKRAGRAYYRMCLMDTDVRASGARLLDWKNNTIKEQYNDSLSASLSSSKLEEHFGAGVGVGDAVLAIPHYLPEDHPLLPGALQGAVPVSALVSKYPDGRQVKKGRKRKAATP